MPDGANSLVGSLLDLRMSRSTILAQGHFGAVQALSQVVPDASSCLFCQRSYPMNNLWDYLNSLGIDGDGSSKLMAEASHRHIPVMRIPN
jgi:hypothetical protein